MTTVAYLAVAPEGRTDRHCVLLNEESRAGLRRLTDAVHAEGAFVAAQIGHAGPVANARSNRAPSLSPSGGFTPMGTRLRAVGVAEIARITEDYRRAALVATEVGFDSIEVHVGHNYLLSAFLSPKLNRRDDAFGGSVENRARFARQVLRTVRDAVGDKVAVTAKLNMADGVPGGLWLEDSLAVAALLEADGVLDALELTGGSSLANPMYLFRGDFEEAFFLPYARQFLAALSTPLILLGGITRLDTIEAALDEGFAFVAMARALLREPDLVARLEAGAATSSLCIHCNKCMPTIYTGTRCVLVTEPGLRR
jgi:2,4-dienoyl-CoA reductase-like NADH-dependent reductase (Old Yellow Enzyme family)